LDTISGIATLDVTAVPTAPNIPAGHSDSGCRFCHTTGGMGPWLASHEDAGYTEDSCRNCHQQS
jgi:hypothetical protein